MDPTPFYGPRAEKTQKADFAMKQTARQSCYLVQWPLNFHKAQQGKGVHP